MSPIDFFPTEYRSDEYSELKAARIRVTLNRLTQRIGERFPGSGLRQVSLEVEEVADKVEDLCSRLMLPIWPVRVLSVLAGLAILAVAVFGISLSLRINPEVNGISDLLQGIESAINEIIFLSIALFFLATLEGRIKRRAALRTLHRLRSFAHVVDMHQLTKDPAYLFSPSAPTASSPERILTAYELARYLDYCSELLSIISKLAALHAQYLNDPVVLNAVNDVETLAHSLAGKVWQKIMILDMAVPDRAGAAGQADVEIPKP